MAVDNKVFLANLYKPHANA